MTATATVAPHLRRARLGVALLFLTNGALVSNLLPRLPEIRADLGISYAQLGVAVAFGPVGALTLGLLAATLIRRWRSSRVAVGGMVLTPLVILAAGVAPHWGLLAAALFAVGAMDAVIDVAQNSHGLRVQRLYRRSILNGFHAIWSVGAVLGGLMSAGAVALDIPLAAHLAISGVVFAAVNVVAYPMLLAGPEPHEPAAVDHGDAPRTRRVPRAVWASMVALAVIAIAGAWVEDAGFTWAASYLRDGLGAPGSIAALGFVSLMAFQFVGRVLGDRMVDRLGQRAVARIGGAVVLVGTGLALAFPSTWGTILGFGAAGFGVATLIPGAMGAADELPGFRAGTGLTILSWALRAGFLLSPPVVGLIADATSLRVGMLVLPVAGLVTLAFAGAMSTRHQRAEGHVEEHTPL